MSLKDDRLADLIQQSYDLKRSDRDQLDHQLLGRVSWDIRCWIRNKEQSRICIMRNHHVAVIRLNDTYSISIGEKHLQNSMTVLKVDDNTALQAREGLYRDAPAVIDQFKRGMQLRTHYQSSAGAVISDELSLLGFTDAFNDMQSQFKKLDLRALNALAL